MQQRKKKKNRRRQKNLCVCTVAAFNRVLEFKPIASTADQKKEKERERERESE